MILRCLSLINTSAYSAQTKNKLLGSKCQKIATLKWRFCRALCNYTSKKFTICLMSHKEVSIIISRRWHPIRKPRGKKKNVKPYNKSCPRPWISLLIEFIQSRLLRSKRSHESSLWWYLPRNTFKLHKIGHKALEIVEIGPVGENPTTILGRQSNPKMFLANFLET